MRKKNKKHSKSDRERFLINIFIYCIFLIGTLIMLYPFYISKLNDYLDNIRVIAYKKELQAIYQSKQEELKQENSQLAMRGLTPSADPFNEKKSKRVSDAYYKTHLLGSVEIPKINIKIPLFDLTNNDLLEIGATTLNGTSYPLGGQNTHAVISAHRGLPNRELFTDLPKLGKGDFFVIEILGRKLAYRVVKIEVVEPEQTDILKIEPGKDLVTLLTCTPYMINSHRLLVTGSRIPYTETVKKELNKSNQNRIVIRFLMIIGFADFIFLMIWFLYRLIHHYLLSKQRIDILIKIIDANHNPFTKTMTLYDKKGKKALKRQQKVVRLLPDPTGYYKIENIPKGLYCLKTDDGSLNLLVGQNKLKNQTLLIKSFKRTKLSFTRIDENEIQLLDVTFNKA